MPLRAPPRFRSRQRLTDGPGCCSWRQVHLCLSLAPLSDQVPRPDEPGGRRACDGWRLISKLSMGECITVKWRGKPVFIRSRTEDEIAEAADVNLAELRDP